MRPFKSTILASGAVVASALLAAVALSQDRAGDAAPVSSTLNIENFIGVIDIQPGAELAYALDNSGGLLPDPDISLRGGALDVDGNQNRGPRGCRHDNGVLKMKWKGRFHPLEDFPKLTITAPESVRLDVELVAGELIAGDVASADLALRGCGDATVGDVADRLQAWINGSGDLIAGRTGSADLKIDGSGDIDLAAVAAGLTAYVAGSGDIEAGRVDGTITLKINGSGDIEIGDGNASRTDISINGSGDISFNGQASDVSVLLNGSGDVYVARSTGNRDVTRRGSGDVRIGEWSYDTD